MSKYYIASCVFTPQFPELSFRIQDYAEKRFGFSIVRCCVPGYKLKEIEERMPEGKIRESWSKLADSGRFKAGDEVWSLCHNCNNIIEEVNSGVKVYSLWELIDSDEKFPIPQYPDLNVTVQDCWRARTRSDEQKAVRSLLDKMQISWQEAPENHEKTEFCGVSLYRPQPLRNPKIAPKFYVEGAVGKFIPHTEEQQAEIMKEYCKQYKTDTVICYCHYCLEGLKFGDVDARHLAQMLFPEL